jgi:hypothetical protein
MVRIQAPLKPKIYVSRLLTGASTNDVGVTLVALGRIAEVPRAIG